MEGDGHYAVSCVESFLDAITVVDVDVDVEDALFEAEKFEDAEDDVWGGKSAKMGKKIKKPVVVTKVEHTIDVAKATSLTFLRVVQPTCPIHSDITFVPVQTRSTFHAAAGTDTAELEEAVEDGTVVADIVLCLLAGEGVHVVRGDFCEELDVLVCMELSHFVSACRFCSL